MTLDLLSFFFFYWLSAEIMTADPFFAVLQLMCLHDVGACFNLEPALAY